MMMTAKYVLCLEFILSIIFIFAVFYECHCIGPRAAVSITQRGWEGILLSTISTLHADNKPIQRIMKTIW